MLHVPVASQIVCVAVASFPGLHGRPGNEASATASHAEKIGKAKVPLCCNLGDGWLFHCEWE